MTSEEFISYVKNKRSHPYSEFERFMFMAVTWETIHMVEGGCVVVKDNNIIAVGESNLCFNSIENCVQRLCYTGQSIRGCTVYTTTEITYELALMLIAVGVRRVVTLNPVPTDAYKLLRDSEITCTDCVWLLG